MIKVCHMTSAHGEEDIRIFHKECKTLAQAGYEVYLVERGESRFKDGVHIIGVGDIPESRRKRMTEGAKKVYEAALKVDADIYHMHDPELLPYGLKLKKRGKKIIFDSHEHYRTQILHKDYLPSWAVKGISKAYGTYEDSILKQYDGVVFPCPMDGRFPLAGKHKVYVDNYPKLEELYDKYDGDAPRDENTVCMIGSLTYNRGVKHFVQAVDRAGCKALVGGDLSPESFKDEILNSPEAKNIDFMGRIDRDQVLEVLQRSKVGVSALLNVGQYNKDNLPTKVFEYMAMGLPVILTKSPFNEEQVEKYGFGICVDPENIEEYAEGIRFLLDNPEESKKMGELGRKAVKEVFNWERESKMLLALYEELYEYTTD